VGPVVVSVAPGDGVMAYVRRPPGGDDPLIAPHGGGGGCGGSEGASSGYTLKL